MGVKMNLLSSYKALLCLSITCDMIQPCGQDAVGEFIPAEVSWSRSCSAAVLQIKSLVQALGVNIHCAARACAHLPLIIVQSPGHATCLTQAVWGGE